MKVNVCSCIKNVRKNRHQTINAVSWWVASECGSGEQRCLISHLLFSFFVSINAQFLKIYQMLLYKNKITY